MQANDNALVLAGDIGGTKTNLAVYAMQGGAPSTANSFYDLNHCQIMEKNRIWTNV